MKRKREISGFTMAEMLIVVAIIAVLGGVGFVAVQNHQKSMAQLERETVAKEIFIAAQNHLTLADSQGYMYVNMENTALSNESVDKSESVPIHIVTNDTNSDYYDINTVDLLNIMLPFGSIDETVRAGGRYFIRYQTNPAQVLDVFYWTPTGQYGGQSVTYNDELLNQYRYDTNKGKRKDHVPMLGWYGGDTVLITGTYKLNAPIIEVENAERLIVKVTNTNADYYVDESNITPLAELKLILSDVTGERKAYLTLNNSTTLRRLETGNQVFTIVLDDITHEGWHFADINTDSDITKKDSSSIFIPGEDIVIQAVAFSNIKLSNIAYSNEVTTNSLFAEISQKTPEGLYADTYEAITGTTYPSTIPDADNTWKTAVIGNARHLENLDSSISGLAMEDIVNAWQVNDIVWVGTDDSFIKKINTGDVTIYKLNDSTGAEANCFISVNPSHMDISGDPFPIALAYEGKGIEKNGDDVSTISHSITGITVNTHGNAGLFGEMVEGSKVSNLKLIDFNITGTGDSGNAGALAGKLAGETTGTEVRNVCAVNSTGTVVTGITGSANAGGLVGEMTGGSIEQCAASLYVQSQTAAGGLIGSATSTTITASYSGGHTEGGLYSENILPEKASEIIDTEKNIKRGLVNVIGTENAGGLIGVANKATFVKYCYSTCSTYAKVSGGFIGKASESVKVAENYAAGLVLAPSGETKRGMLLGDGKLTLDESVGTNVSNYYVSGINGTLISGVTNVNPEKPIVKVLELSRVITQQETKPYDLPTLQGKTYCYLTIAQINSGKSYENEPDYLKIHYGDWQEPITLETNLELINAEKLTAKVSFPESKLGSGQTVTMLIQGASGKNAHLIFNLEKTISSEPGSTPVTNYSLTLREVSGIATKNIKGEDLTADGWLTIAKNGPTSEEGNIVFSIDLDDITTLNGHFAELFPDFVPGEDVTVVVHDNDATLDEMKAYMEEEWIIKDDDGNIRTLAGKTNSLFAAISNDKNASIANFRHLENLDMNVSELKEGELPFQKATQTENLVWSDFLKAIDKDNSANVMVYYGEAKTDGGYFKPVTPGYVLNYDGQTKGESGTVVNHSIMGVMVKNTTNAGLFGSMISDSKVSNLELIDFEIKEAVNAGVLAGELSGTTVTNVVAYHSSRAVDVVDVTGTGNVGGLIGSMSGGAVERSAAAVIVSGKDAGGLIGAASGGARVSASYSGGHTNNATYYDDSKQPIYNVKGTANAGGLIGNAGNATISNSYSTCSATGATAGGFVGTGTGDISYCYATGLVEGTSAEGAFAASLSKAENCWYYEIINEDMKAIPGETTIVINAIDKDATSYDDFVKAPTSWNPAEPYDGTLETLFENGFNLKTVDQLGKSTKSKATETEIESYFAYTHYGDWPAPEQLVINVE